MKRFRRTIMTALGMSLLAGGLLAASVGPVAASGYGPGAVYQVELTANLTGPQGGGVWLWVALYPGGTGDYNGSDCGHGLGAVSDKGDVTWTTVGNLVRISGVVLNGLGGFRTTITIPASYGHYTGTIGSYLTLPGFIPPLVGFSQLQVAP
jgi:hypothetical protein